MTGSWLERVVSPTGTETRSGPERVSGVESLAMRESVTMQCRVKEES